MVKIRKNRGGFRESKKNLLLDKRKNGIISRKIT